MFGQGGEYVGNLVPVHVDVVQVDPVPQAGFLVLGGAGASQANPWPKASVVS